MMLTTMQSWWRLGARLTVLIMFAALATFVAAVPAQAATPLGSLTLDPATGQAISPITVTTVSSGASKGCPAEATNVGGIVTGPGGWAIGIGAFSNSDTEIQHSSEFSVPMVNSFASIAADNTLTVLPGKYTITLYCQDQFGVTQFGEFAASVWFTDSTHYQSTDPDAPAPATPTSTTLSATPASTAVAGASVSLTAAVTPAAATGTVQFTDSVGGTTVNVGPAVTVTAGTASASTTTLATGTHSLKAVFTPTDAAAFTASTSVALGYTITAPPTPATPTTTTLSATPPSGAVAGDEVTLVAAVAPAAATGTVQFTDTLGGSTVSVGAPVTVAGGSATLATTSLSTATHSLKAVFTPADAAAYEPSTSAALTYQVAAPPVEPVTPTLTLAGPASVTEGADAQFTLTIAPAAAAGVVQLTDTFGGTTSDLGGPITLAGGTGSFSTADLAVGSHAVKAAYTPEDAGAYKPVTSQTVTVVVTAAPQDAVETTTELEASPASPSGAGDPVTFTAAVSPDDAVGSVRFTATSGGSPVELGIEPVTGGTAELTTSSLAVGQSTIVAAFVPTDPTKFLPSQSSALTYTIAAPPTEPTTTTAGLTAAPASGAPVNADVTLTAAIAPANAVGSVQFFDVQVGTTVPLGASVNVTGGTAKVTTRFTTAGSHALRAVFTPTDPAAFTPSTSADLAYTVTPAENPQAKSTRTWLTGWATGWCPKEISKPVTSMGSLDGRPGTWHQRKCYGQILVAQVRPGTAAGAVQFTDTTKGSTAAPVGAPVAVSNGWAVLFVEVTKGKHSFAATFTPANPAAYKPSTSNRLWIDVGHRHHHFNY